MYSLCRVTPHNHSVEMLCIFMGESSSQHVIILKNLATIWESRGKMLYQKRGSCKSVLPLKNWIDWITTRPEKNITTSKMYILRRRSVLNLKDICFLLWLASITLLLKQKPVELKRPLSLVWRFEIVYVWYIYSLIKKNKKTCNVKKNKSKCTKFAIKN